MAYGDRLASGGKSATFYPSPQITKEQWDKIWEDEKKSPRADMIRGSLVLKDNFQFEFIEEKQ